MSPELIALVVGIFVLAGLAWIWIPYLRERPSSREIISDRERAPRPLRGESDWDWPPRRG